MNFSFAVTREPATRSRGQPGEWKASSWIGSTRGVVVIVHRGEFSAQTEAEDTKSLFRSDTGKNESPFVVDSWGRPRLVWRLQEANHRRPNLKNKNEGCWREFKLRFGRFSGRSHGSIASEAWNVLLFLLSGFEDLC